MHDALVFIVRFLLFVALHSLLAMPAAKRAVCRDDSREAPWYRLTYNLISTIVLIWAVSAWRSSPVLYFVPGVASLIMYALQAVVGLALCICLYQTGFGSFSGLDQVRGIQQPEQLQVTGFYGVVRHPLYLLTTVFMLINPVMSAQWLTLTLLSVCYFIAGAVIEERRLVRLFGSEYERYQQQVPFFLPRLQRFRQPSE